MLESGVSHEAGFWRAGRRGAVGEACLWGEQRLITLVPARSAEEILFEEHDQGYEHQPSEHRGDEQDGVQLRVARTRVKQDVRPIGC